MTAFFALYYIVPFKLKNYCLLFFSLLFYAWGEPIYVFLMMFSAGVDWLDGLFLEKHPKHKKLYLTIAIVIKKSFIVPFSLCSNSNLPFSSRTVVILNLFIIHSNIYGA